MEKFVLTITEKKGVRNLIKSYYWAVEILFLEDVGLSSVCDDVGAGVSDVDI